MAKNKTYIKVTLLWGYYKELKYIVTPILGFDIIFKINKNTFILIFQNSICIIF